MLVIILKAYYALFNLIFLKLCKIDVIIVIFKWENWVIEYLNDLPKVKQLVKSGPKVQTQAPDFRAHAFLFYVLVWSQKVEIKGDDSLVSGLSS